MAGTSQRWARRGAAFGAVALTASVAATGLAAAAPGDSTLIGYATLPATTFAAGPASGAAITPTVNNGITSPFASQPVQGFSAVKVNTDGTVLAMADNGFGAKGNSADFLLRAYTVTPSFEVGAMPLPAPLTTGAGGVTVQSFIQFRDPDGKVPFPIVNGATPERLLTGADFDIESMVVLPAGDIWIGEEFGPYLLHFDATGKLLDPPVALPDFSTADPTDELKSPSNPTLGGAVARVPGSGGFEGMALSTDGTKLLPLLERPLDNTGSTLLIHEFDLATKTYNGVQYEYDLTAASVTTAAGTNIGDFIVNPDGSGLVIERNGNQGSTDPLQSLKRIYRITFPAPGAGTKKVTKTLAADLLRIADPQALSGPGSPGDAGVGNPFAFPFVTIEDVALLGPDTILVMNDNNFPFSLGRHLGTGAPDDNEFIVLRLDNSPEPVIPEAPFAVLLLLSALVVGGGTVILRNRRPTARPA